MWSESCAIFDVWEALSVETPESCTKRTYSKFRIFLNKFLAFPMPAKR